jgi:hypothetical protein
MNTGLPFERYLLRDLRRAGPKGHVDESGLLFFVAAFVLPYTIYGHGDLRDGRPFGRVPELRSPREAPQQIYSIQCCHRLFSALGFVVMRTARFAFELGVAGFMQHVAAGQTSVLQTGEIFAVTAGRFDGHRGVTFE